MITDTRPLDSMWPVWYDRGRGTKTGGGNEMANPIIIHCPHCGTQTTARSKRWTQVLCRSCNWAFVNPDLFQ